MAFFLTQEGFYLVTFFEQRKLFLFFDFIDEVIWARSVINMIELTKSHNCGVCHQLDCNFLDARTANTRIESFWRFI